jgi:hypothetical protein
LQDWRRAQQLPPIFGSTGRREVIGVSGFVGIGECGTGDGTAKRAELRAKSAAPHKRTTDWRIWISSLDLLFWSIL